LTSQVSSLDQSMPSSPGYRFGTFFSDHLTQSDSHFSLGAHSSGLRPREIMIKNMIDLDGVPSKRTVHYHSLRSDSAAFLCAQLEDE
ncbi:hypothetical protein B0H65DRAFT_430298, partial [Neurospora tetraspora]